MRRNGHNLACKSASLYVGSWLTDARYYVTGVTTGSSYMIPRQPRGVGVAITVIKPRSDLLAKGECIACLSLVTLTMV